MKQKLAVNAKNFSIWRYACHYPRIPKARRLTLGEGWTKDHEIQALSRRLDLRRLFFKREDLNPTGSHKDRGLAYQVSKAWDDGQKELVLPSSGNCAIAAAAYCNLARIRLTVYIDPEVACPKMAQLARFDPQIIRSRAPIEDAAAYADARGVRNLSPEIEPNASYGFRSIAFEIFEWSGPVDQIFIPVSSAASLVGIGWANLEMRRSGLLRMLPELHAVQTRAIAPIAGEFVRFTKAVSSIAEGIMAKETARKAEAVRLIQESRGWGWVVSDNEIRAGLRILNRFGIDASPEGGAAFAAVLKAQKKRPLGRVVCLLTGHGLKWTSGPC
jgi:threonine synthase